MAQLYSIKLSGEEKTYPTKVPSVSGELEEVNKSLRELELNILESLATSAAGVAEGFKQMNLCNDLVAQMTAIKGEERVEGLTKADFDILESGQKALVEQVKKGMRTNVPYEWVNARGLWKQLEAQKPDEEIEKEKTPPAV
jgi:hypothetical protein